MQKLSFGKVLIKESMESKKYTKKSLKAQIREMILAEMSYSQLDPSDEFDENIGEELKDRRDNGEITEEQFQDALDYLSSDTNSYDLFHEFGRENLSSAADAILERMTSLDEAKKKKGEKEDVAPQEDVDIDLNMGDEQLPAEPAGEEPPMDTVAPDTTAGDIDPTVKSIQDSLQKAFAQAKTLGDEKLMNQIGNTITMLVRTQVLGQQNVNENEDFNPFMDWKDDQIYDSLINIDQEQLVSQMMNAVEENPSITLFEFCKKFED
jgi:hypothetical protein